MAAEPARAIRSHIWEREQHEHYVEPSWCSMRLFEEEKFTGAIWDPCCGFGTIPRSAAAAGLNVLATDLVDRGYGGLWKTVNFFDCQQPYAAGSIVCNPPFNIAKDFALHALKLADKVAMIMPVPRLNAAHWLQNTPLETVWLLTPRPSMPPGHVIAAGEKPGGGKTDYCWLVWDRSFAGRTEMKWLRRDPLKC
jgi:hypothetical protein